MPSERAGHPAAATALDRIDLTPHVEQPAAHPPSLSEDEWESLEGAARMLTNSGWYRVLRRFRRRDAYREPSPPDVRLALFVDVETTGLDTATDGIIELAAVPFEFDPEGRVYRVGEPLQYFEDPGVPIPPSITELTGITDEMVRGKRIDEEAVAALASRAALVIAHNADFDRRMVERRLPLFADLHWACSQREVPWERFGCRGMKLEYLLLSLCGEFHDGHRAADDCLAAIHALAHPRCEGRTPLAYLLESARQPTIRVWALDAPFAAKDLLKGRRYRWSDGVDGRPKAWFRDVTRVELQAEETWLAETVYGDGAARRWRVDQITARSRYSARA